MTDVGQIGETIDRTIVGWRIWYGDSTMLSGNDKTSFLQAPADNVQIVMIFHAGQYRAYADGVLTTYNYRDCKSGHDFYWLKDNFLYAGGLVKVPNDLDDGSLKEGAWMDTGEYKALLDSAMQVKDVP